MVLLAPADRCPVCGELVDPNRAWLVRKGGRWLRFRCGDCVEEYERGGSGLSSSHPHPEHVDASPASEWACYTEDP